MTTITFQIKPPNPNALKTLEFIRSYYDRHKYPPCIREIGDAVGISSTSVVNYYIRDLARRNLIKWTPGIPRSYVPIELFDDPCKDCAYKALSDGAKMEAPLSVTAL